MAEVRMISSRIWQDSWFCSLPLNARLLFLFLISNKSTHVSGYYEMPMREIEFQTGLKAKQVEAAFKALAPKVLYLNNWVCIQNYLRHQNLSNNEKVSIAVEKYMVSVPAEVKKISEEVFSSNDKYNSNYNKSLSIGYGYPISKEENPENKPPNDVEKDGDKTGEKKRYGEFKNVLLTDEEKQKLKTRYGTAPIKALLEELSTGIKSKGYRYKDHYATLLSWAKRKNLEDITPRKVDDRYEIVNGVARLKK